jgi:hypothetical protein
MGSQGLKVKMANTANDNFQTYFTEKLWEMIPAFYRDEDGLAENPGVLRSIVEIVAQQATYLRRSSDHLWDDQFIDLCSAWAIPYIADLVGTRLVSSLNQRGQRIDVAKTIYYRRRKGTLRVLEELISDIAGWEGVVNEEFRRLARTFHGLDPAPRPLAGRFTETPPGGWADLRSVRGSELTDGPFDEYFHAADVRKQRGTDGRFNIPKIAFHIYRIPARRVTGVVPMPGPNNRAFTFDPSGRDIPLFMRRSRREDFDWNRWRSLREWELPAPMHCRVLGHSEYVIREALVLELISNLGLNNAAANDLRKLLNTTFTSEAKLRSAISVLPNSAALLAGPVIQAILQRALIQDCGKSVLLTSYVSPGSLLPKSIRVETAPGAEVTSDLITAGNLKNFSGAATNKRLIIDPERGRLLFLGAAPPATVKVDYHYGFSAEIGAGGFDRSEYYRRHDPPNERYPEDNYPDAYDRSAFSQPPTLPVLINSAAITAADIDTGAANVIGATEIGDSSTFGPVGNKSGIQNTIIKATNFERPYLRLASSWVLDTGAQVESFLTLEGLWIGASGNFSLVLRGDYERVTIRHCTLDPGGVDAQNNPIASLPLVVEGAVEKLLIDHSIIGPIRIQGAGAIEKLIIRDSIVQSIAPLVPAIDVPTIDVEMFRTTVFGAVSCNQLNASEVLITGPGNVTDTQNGCFRFSAVLAGSRVPHPYESHFITDTNHFFTSRSFGQPGYAQLSLTAPPGLLRGAENGSEIGAFSGQHNPIRFDGLRAKVDEFLPFGLIPVYLFET